MCLSKELLYSHVGRKIKEIRKRNKLSQEKFGEKIECSRVVVSLMEHGKQQCPIERIYKMSELFCISPLFFLPCEKDVFIQTQLCIGDIVMLNSGGPKMTVFGITQNVVYCCWFEANQMMKRTFCKTCLRKVNLQN